MFPNKFVWLIGVDVEFVLPCRSDPLGRYGDESAVTGGQILLQYVMKQEPVPVFVTARRAPADVL